jgi:hypothetical protein
VGHLANPFLNDPSDYTRARGNPAGRGNSQLQLANHLRTVSLYFSGVRSAPINYLDLSTIKKTDLTERFKLEFRAEFLNALNHTVFEAPDTTPTDSLFGQVTSAKTLNRTVQFGLVMRF